MELEQIRDQINFVNEELLRLFEQRMTLCAQVAAYKQEHQMEVFVPAREEEILRWVQESGQDALCEYDVQFFRCLLELSRSYQKSIIKP